MSTDYIVAALPSLKFDEKPSLTWEDFLARTGFEERGEFPVDDTWRDLETELKNTLAELRGGEKFKRKSSSCSLFWRNRIISAYAERDVLKREEALDRVWWDAAGELTPAASPLGKGALSTYAIRLKIALKRAKISKDKGNEAFDRLTAETKL